MSLASEVRAQPPMTNPGLLTAAVQLASSLLFLPPPSANGLCCRPLLPWHALLCPHGPTAFSVYQAPTGEKVPGTGTRSHYPLPCEALSPHPTPGAFCSVSLGLGHPRKDSGWPFGTEATRSMPRDGEQGLCRDLHSHLFRPGALIHGFESGVVNPSV